MFILALCTLLSNITVLESPRWADTPEPGWPFSPPSRSYTFFLTEHAHYDTQPCVPPRLLPASPRTPFTTWLLRRECQHLLGDQS